MGAVYAVEYTCVLCGHCIQNELVSRVMNLHQILHEAWTFFCGKYSDDSQGCSYGQLVIGIFIMTTCPLMHHISWRIFGETSNHPSDSTSLQAKFGALRLLSFPKTKITFEREEISDCRWDSGLWQGSWWWLEELWEVPRCHFEEDWGVIVLLQYFLYLVSSSINVSIFKLHGCVPSGQTF